MESPTGEADRLETFNGPPGPHIIALSGPVLTAPTTTTEELRRFLVSLHTTLSREVGNFLDGGQQQSQESGILKKVGVQLVVVLVVCVCQCMHGREIHNVCVCVNVYMGE